MALHSTAMFDPTQKQLDALANMETYADIHSHRTHFATCEAFRDYWVLVSGRCDRISRQRQRGAAAGSSHPQQRRGANQDPSYQDEEHLVAYGSRYARRYRPAAARLRAQLLSKAQDPDLCDRVMARLAHLVDDRARARSLAEDLRASGKPRHQIRNALRRRRLATAAIDQALADLEDEDGSLWDQQALRATVARLQRKGLSLQAIRQHLTGGPTDRLPVEKELARASAVNGDATNLRQALDRLLRRGADEATILRRLRTKGFAYGAIRQALAET